MLDDYYNVMLVRKHYGLTLTEINSSISWGEWICLYATALDAEEMSSYMDALRSGMKKEEWKWSHADIARRMNSTNVKGGIRAGDKPLRDRSNRQIEGTVKQLFGDSKARDITSRFKGTAQEAAMALGHELVEITDESSIPDGYVFIEYDPNLARTTWDPAQEAAAKAPPAAENNGLLGLLGGKIAI